MTLRYYRIIRIYSVLCCWQQLFACSHLTNKQNFPFLHIIKIFYYCVLAWHTMLSICSSRVWFNNRCLLVSIIKSPPNERWQRRALLLMLEAKKVAKKLISFTTLLFFLFHTLSLVSRNFHRKFNFTSRSIRRKLKIQRKFCECVFMLS